MAKEMPLHDGEVIAETDYSRKEWIVQPRVHTGHTMTVLGNVERDGRTTGMLIVRCSCGETFRMSRETVTRALDRKCNT